ncbi:2Fe-2S iron-sulfur cluster binding domain-containing protein [Gilvimarinus sp. DA14]|uniref:2Fe-2S iron-sulfur cluster-binding protein n=1 Tax=Gilvimarinus sp. DA14 TaxID=2956798 RepID=UPI0020B675CE|nr:2Fe-2S iron-sulfur cluster binding domain-containing protein [Gilvimarinus sp. DA14]UTF59877.1 2Fe-2S iron-sulfur cluster binding domain-containing protein [Gilvimarinus sp. DA14]
MVKLVVEKQILEPEPGASLLDTLLQNGYQVPYSCRAGVCQSCLVQAQQGPIPAQAQLGLSDTQKAKQLLMSCRCDLQSDMQIQLYDPRNEQVQAEVTALTPLSERVLELQLQCDLKFRAGQHITLWRDQQIARCYSIASLPADGRIALHIGLQPNGRFSQWARQHLQKGSILPLTGPAGDCYYRDDDPDRALLFAGTGTGIAPLYAIARDALSQGHRGDITILYCGVSTTALYWRQALQDLAQANPQISLQCLVQREARIPETQLADAYDYVKQTFKDLHRHRIYLCGAPSFVQKMRKQCFLKGAKPREVYFDAFEAAQ